MTKAVAISYEELAANFRYEDGRLFKLGQRHSPFFGQWREIDLTKPNDAHGYVRTNIKGKWIKAHRVIYSLFYKIDIPEEMQIDHTNGLRCDNHICNLELVTRRGNGRNQQCHRVGHLCGSHWERKSGKWMSKVAVCGKQIRLGYYDTQQEAHEAYLAYCKEKGLL